MDKTINRLKIIFLAIFALAAGAAWTHQLMWAKPRRECEARGNWWSDKHRACAVPIDITQITGRPRGGPAAPSPAQPDRPATPPAAPPAQ